MNRIQVAWWNLENLFDAQNAPTRDPVLQRTLNRALQGWTAAVRDRKIAQLARVIDLMFDGSGPDLLGVCEVENEGVLQVLADALQVPGRNYQVAHHDSQDARGIDTSFLFDANTLRMHERGDQTVFKRSATRDLFWVEFEVLATRAVFIAVANHWPSRSGGRYETEPFRILVGETLSFTLEQIFREFEDGNEIPAVIMGDFNDEPFDRSMREYLLSTRERIRVTRSRTPRLHNLMWPLMSGKEPGTFRFSSDWLMVDQFLVNKGMLLRDSLIGVEDGSVAVFRPDIMRKSNGEPRRFGRPSRSLDRDGFSDHFPVTMVLRVRDSS